MEKTLYIPTSSLNFNCIVSSESISPAAYYAQRSFGMKRFIDIFDGRYPDSIIASEQQSSFTRPPSDVEDHPMLIETLIEENDTVSLGTGFYAINKTIYITPYTTRFLFFSEHDRLVSESLSEHSLEFKLSNLYLPKMLVVCPVENYSFEGITTIPHERRGADIQLDERVNRLKGMLYGYYLGALLSSDEVEVKKLQILLDVQNEFSAIISSGMKNLSVDKEKRLRELSSYWRNLSPLYMELQDAGIDVPQLMDILAKYKVRLPINNLGISLYTQYLTRSFAEDANNPATEWIEREIDSQRNAMRNGGKRLNPENDVIITDGKNVINIQTIDRQDLVKHWFNNLLLDSSIIVPGESGKMELADKITDSAIEYLGASWKESPERAFLNKLRRHIGGESFDVAWSDDTLSSVAAVVLRGDEWDTLLDFMQRKGMSDYRLAFAMYGALTGYANMTRDFVDQLYEGVTERYIRQIYSEFHGQIFGYDIPTQELPNNSQRTKSERIIISNPSKPEVMAILSMIRNHPDYKNTPKYDSNCKEIEVTGMIDWDAIESLGQWKGFISKVRPDKGDIVKSSRRTSSIIYRQESLFEENTFCRDREAWNKISDIVPREVQSKIKADLVWFQKEVSRRNAKYGYDKINPEDNKEVIEKYYWLKWGTDSKGKKKAPYYSEELRRAIKERLMSLYCSNE